LRNFLESDGIDRTFGLSATPLAKVQVNRAMIEISRTMAAVCDSSALGRRDCGMIAPATALHRVVTDQNISNGDSRWLRVAEIEATLV